MGSPVRNVKASVEYVCSLLSSLGLGGLSPELLRQAKFNSAAVVECLLRAVHDLVMLQLTEFPNAKVPLQPVPGAAQGTTSTKSSSNRGTPPPCCSSNTSSGLDELRGTGGDAGATVPGVEPSSDLSAARAVLDELWRTVGNQEQLDDILAFVKHYLALWGFPGHSPLFVWSLEAQQSRHLLLALGWLVSHTRALERGFHNRIQPLLAARASAPLPPYPADVGSTPQAAAKGHEAGLRAQQHVDRVLSSLNGVAEPCKRAEARAQQALMLYGKIQATFKSVYSLRCCKAKRLHQLNQAQIDAAIENEEMRPFSPYELHLLQDKEALKLHITALEAEKRLAEEAEGYESHEQLFWEWMESVVHEAQHGADDLEGSTKDGAPHHGTDPHCIQGVSAADLEPVIQFLQQHLSADEGTEPQEARSPPHNVNIVEGVHMLPPDIAQRMREAYEAQDLESQGGLAPPREEAYALPNVLSLGLGVEPLYVLDQTKPNTAGARRHAPPKDAVECTAADRLEGLALTNPHLVPHFSLLPHSWGRDTHDNQKRRTSSLSQAHRHSRHAGEDSREGTSQEQVSDGYS